MNPQSQNSSSNRDSPLRGFDFTRDWLAGEKFPANFLGPSDDLLRIRLDSLSDGSWSPWTTDEIDDLRQFNLDGGNAAGTKFADALGKKDALVVVTGQQPDFLASPLYVLHKALSAVAWSRRLSKELKREVVPIFWVASDDDDFAELKKSWLASYKGELVNAGGRINRGRGLNSGSPSYLWSLSESSDRAKQDVQRALSGWPGGDTVAEDLEKIIDSNPNFELQFCQLLSRLLGDDNAMLFVAPRLKALRRRQSEVLKKDVLSHHSVNQKISECAEEFRQAGYPVTLERDTASLNFFWLSGNSRHRLIRDGQEIVATDPHSHTESRRFSEKELLQVLDESPEEFAPNVVTRPVIQDIVLPTAAYIAGPGELAYLAVLGLAYTEYRCIRSAVIPRTLVTMEPRCELQKWTGGKQPENLAEEVLSRGGETSEVLLNRITALLSDTHQQIQEMRAIAVGERAEVQLALDKTEHHFLHGIEQLKKRVARQVAPGQWNRAARLATIISPGGAAQERTLAPWNFVKAHDWSALARHLAASIDYTATDPQTASLPDWVNESL